MTKLHYAILTAWRDSTQSRIVRLVSYSGRKLEGLGQRMNDMESELGGGGWEVHGEITSRLYFEVRQDVMKRQEETWDARLQ